jgi:hypothetical protein
MTIVKRASTTLLAFTLTIGGVMALGAAPAQASEAGIASPSSGFVDGDGGTTNQWAGEGVLGEAYHRNSGATGLWQAFLFSQGYLGSRSDIDCHFGGNTATATANFQADNGLGDDGIVGAATFGRADDYLRFESTEGGGTKYYYSGSGSRKQYFVRVASSGEFLFKTFDTKYGLALSSTYGSIPSSC